MIRLLLTIAAGILAYVARQDAASATSARIALKWTEQAADALRRADAARERVSDVGADDDPYRRD